MGVRMDFQSVLRQRRMVRQFKPDPLPPEAVERLLSNAQRGPSSGFTQGFDFIVFQGAEETARFWAATAWQNDPFFAGARNAPLIIVPVAHAQAYVERYLAPDKASAGRHSAADFPAPYWYTDTASASMLILLTAVDLGLGGFYFSLGPNQRSIPPFCAALSIPAGHEPLGAIAVGYSAEDVTRKTIDHQSIKQRRRAPESMIHRGQW